MPDPNEHPATHPKIDWDRGVHQRAKDSESPKICHYPDDPGVFYLSNGQPATDEQAREAGFDVPTLTKERELKRRVAAERERIEREMAGFEEEATERLRAVEAEPDVVEPYLKKNKAGDPRATHLRRMDWNAQSQSWEVYDQLTQELLGSDLDQEAAETMLLDA